MRNSVIGMIVVLGMLAAAGTVSAQEASCVGFCGDESADGCFCDASCFIWGDCCPDVCTACPEYQATADQCADLTNCGDKKCDAAVGEDCENCALDCGCTKDQVCFNDACCSPTCTEDTLCLDDGCGGLCNLCVEGLECLGGKCAPAIDPTEPGCAPVDAPTCGGCECEACVCAMDPYCCDTEWDGICVGECVSCGSCVGPLPACGDGVCDTLAGDYCDTCEADCGCAEGDICMPSGECCTPTCEGKVCGDDGCGGDCGACMEGMTCQEGKCLVPGPGCAALGTPTCGGCACEECVCAMDSWCCENGWDGLCVAECNDQCGGCFFEMLNCGNGVCEPAEGETCYFCPGDCACGEDQTCFNGNCCTPTCTKENNCMDDGCGGVCNLCNEGLECVGGKCSPPFDTTSPGCAVAGPPTCGGCECEACVCGMDPYCCNNSWDGLCVNECIQCGSCTADLPTCGDGTCDPYAAEYCNTCEDDCGCPEGDVCTMAGTCCTQTCGDKECGDDGCGGTCGVCADGLMCMDGFCLEPGPGCLPSEFPGCGGCPCEECVFAMDSYCADTAWDGFCVDECINACGGCAVVLPNCGDGTCSAEEGENCKWCEEDCSCGGGETCTTAGECCVPSCEGKPCGDDGCGGECGPCGPGLGCVEGACTPIEGPTDCLGMGTPSGEDCFGLTYEGCCDATGRVLFCDGGKLFCIDCAAQSPSCGWQAGSLFYDCNTDGSADPSGQFPKDCVIESTECTPDCDGKVCGDDGCEGSCGKCGPDKECVDGACQEPCVPACVDKECGDNGCGGDCGTCEGGETCSASGKCEPACDALANCEGKDCGDDGCGGTCGECAGGFECSAEGKCTPVCDPAANCEGRACGPDGCGGTCGECDKGLNCTEEGQCVAIAVDEGVTEDVATEEDKVSQDDLQVGDSLPADEDKDEGGGGGGGGSCSTTGSGTPASALVLGALLLAVAALRRRLHA